MKDTKVISLRGRLAGNGISSAPENPQLATILEIQTPGVCLRCGAAGVIDYLDLVAGHAKLHCSACPHYWDEALVEPEDESARAELAARRADAAMRRLHH